MAVREWIELVAVATIPITILGLFVDRWLSGRGLGVRAIQMLAAATFAPTIIVLAMERVIDGCTVAALMGAFAGYLFYNIADFDRKRGRETSEKST